MKSHQLGSSDGWAVTHDGETLKKGFPDDFAAVKWLHDRHSYSVDHAVRHEGYDIVLVRDGQVAWSYKRDVIGKLEIPKDPAERALLFERDVRNAFVTTYGVPKDPDYVERAIRSSYLGPGKKLGWTEPDPDVVLVLTEFAWVSDPYSSEEDRDHWQTVTGLLRSRGWANASWDSVNAAVQVVFWNSKKIVIA